MSKEEPIFKLDKEKRTNAHTRKRRTTEDWVKQAKSVHPNYDYSKVVYINNRTKLIIICPKHGELEVTPAAWIKGRGCVECAKKKAPKSMLTLVEDLGMHYPTNSSKRRYRYGLYNCACGGEIETLISSVVGGSITSCGCTHAKPIHTVNSLLAKFTKVHGDRYDYSKVSIRKDKKVTIICPKHGEFEQYKHVHLKGQGCRLCGIEAARVKKRRTQEEFITEARQMWGEEHYDYTDTIYEGAENYVEVRCRIHDNVFRQRAYGHLVGSEGCKECSHAGGFRTDLPGTLYYLSINNGEAYKIGVTNQSVKKRYSLTDMENIKIIKEWKYADGRECLDEESRILREFKQYKYNGVNLLEDGNSELFTRDILQLDIGEIGDE